MEKRNSGYCEGSTKKEAKELRRRYYSTQACVQTQGHSLFPHSHNPEGQISDGTGEKISRKIRSLTESFRFYWSKA